MNTSKIHMAGITPIEIYRWVDWTTHAHTYGGKGVGNGRRERWKKFFLKKPVRDKRKMENLFLKIDKRKEGR